MLSTFVSITCITRCHLLGVVMLAKACSCALCELFQLGDSIVIAAKVARKCSLRVRSDRTSLVDKVVAADLLLVAFQSMSKERKC